MLEITKRKFFFKIKEIWFAETPFDIDGCSSVIFYDCKNKVDALSFKRKDFPTLIIDLRKDLNTIWKNINKSSTRCCINRAKKEGIKVKLNKHHEEFYRINQLFRKNKKLPCLSEGINFLKEYGILFIAEFNDEIIGGQVYLEDKDNVRWLLGASKRLRTTKEIARRIGDANRLLIWEAIKYAKNKGIKEFDMGGYYIGIREDKEQKGINFFKKSFGGKLTARYIYRKDYSRIYKLFTGLKRFLLRKT